MGATTWTLATPLFATTGSIHPNLAAFRPCGGVVRGYAGVGGPSGTPGNTRGRVRRPSTRVANPGTWAANPSTRAGDPSTRVRRPMREGLEPHRRGLQVGVTPSQGPSPGVGRSSMGVRRSARGGGGIIDGGWPGHRWRVARESNPLSHSSEEGREPHARGCAGSATQVRRVIDDGEDGGRPPSPGGSMRGATLTKATPSQRARPAPVRAMSPFETISRP